MISAHQIPARLEKYVSTARERGVKVIIAGAGKAAVLPGAAAALTSLPVLGVPMKTADLDGRDSLLSIVQMPAGTPVGTLAIGTAGATNAGLFAAAIPALGNDTIAGALKDWRDRPPASVPDTPCVETQRR